MAGRHERGGGTGTLRPMLAPLPHVRHPRAAAFLAAILAAALGLFLWLAVGVVRGDSWSVHDPAVTAWAVAGRRAPLTVAARVVTEMGGTLGLTVLTALAAGPWRCATAVGTPWC